MDERDGPDCAATLKELDTFLDDELSTETRIAITHHLKGCPDCHGAFDFHAELKIVIGKKCRDEEMPPDLLGRIERCFSADFDGDGSIG